MARKFYVLSLEIYKIKNLPDKTRGIIASDFLNAKYNMYIKLYEESNLLKRRYKKGQLAKMDESLLLSDNNINSSSSYNETHNNIIVSDNDSLIRHAASAAISCSMHTSQSVGKSAHSSPDSRHPGGVGERPRSAPLTPCFSPTRSLKSAWPPLYSIKSCS